MWMTGSLMATMLAVGADPTGHLAVGRLRCEYHVDPEGLEVRAPRLSWVVTSPRRGAVQTAYRILVAGDAERLARDEGDLWDSGKVTSHQTAQIAYAGRELRSRERCWWKVMVWDNDDRPSTWSEPARWSMGLLEPEDWVARWIGHDGPAEPGAGPDLAGAVWIWLAGDAPTVYFRRGVTVPDGVTAAKLVITCDDQFVLYVDGVEAARSDGRPDAWRRPVEVDLSDRLTPGDHLLAVHGTNTGGPAGLAGRLRLSGPAEPTELIIDGTWRASVDEDPGWEQPGFDDSGWPTATVVGAVGDAPWGLPRIGGAGELPPSPFLRRPFAVAGTVRRATAYVSALGLYELRLNGRKVGDAVFTPGWTDYRRRVPYQTYDVTDLVRTGDNVVGLILGDGWYCGHVGLGGRERYGPSPRGLLQLEIETDRGVETIVTDTSWRGSYGPIREADLLMGEAYDARRELVGWDEAGYDDSGWAPVVVGAPFETRLEAHPGAPVRPLLELPARTLTEPQPGVYVFDLGQNMVGWARLRVAAPAGTTVRLRFAEMLNPDGTLYTTNLRSARCTDYYTCRGGGVEVWEPRFTFRGFRYVELTGLPERPGLDAVVGVVAHSDTPRVGSFSCSNPMVNQLQHNIEWGQRGNFLEVPTDCPQRDERLGWMGDAQVFIETATDNMDVAAFFTKWLIDVEDAQSPEGAYSDVAPRVAAGEGVAAWADAGVICPWVIYIRYGDRRVLERHYPAMTKYIDYLRAHSNGLLRGADGYGDWLSIRADTPKDVLATAFFAYSTGLVAQIAGVLGKTADAERYEALREEIKAAFNRAYVAPDGRIRGNTQTVYVLALKMDLLSPEHRAAAIEYLAQDILARDGHLSTGFVGTAYLMPTLSDNGRTDLAYRLLLNDTFPSWGYTIKHGATTIWERWDGWTAEHGFQDPGMNSFNHYAFGAVGDWLYGTVAGIRADPERPGYERVIIRPEPGGGLTHAEAEIDTIRGRVASAWRIATGRLTLRVTVPANTRATVHVPTSDPGSVTESGRPAATSDGVSAIAPAVYDIGSGEYIFEAAWD